MLKHIAGDKTEYYSTVNGGGSINSSGRLDPGIHVWSPPDMVVIAEQDSNAYLSEINAVGTVSDPLPPQGTELEAGKVYAWEGQNVIVRQDHTRTEHDPDTVPALFLVYRADYEGMEWIPNEQVMIGDQRLHDAITYECIQSHVTVVGQTPDLTPALWVVIPDETGEWQAGVAYAIDDVVLHLAIEYICIQAHTSQIGWEPDVTPALWTPT